MTPTIVEPSWLMRLPPSLLMTVEPSWLINFTLPIIIEPDMKISRIRLLSMLPGKSLLTTEYVLLCNETVDRPFANCPVR
jgi:hypothetical protein